VILKHRFYLPAYSDNDDADTPSHFFVTLTIDKAAYFLRRIALFETIAKVDGGLKRMIYKSGEGEYYYQISDEGHPETGSMAQSIEEHDVYVDEDGIFWVSTHGETSCELMTQRIDRHLLENLSKGLHPNNSSAPDHPVASINPMQMLNEAVFHAVDQGPMSFFVAPPTEAEVNTNDSGDEGEDP